MKKKIIIVVSIIIIIIISGYFIYRAIWGAKESEYNIVSVTRGEITQNVSITGTVIPSKQIDLQFESTGKIEKIEVEVGSNVTSTQVLVRLNTAELNAEYQSKQASLSIARVKLAQILAGTKEEDIKVYEAVVEKAEIDVTNKEQALIDVQNDADNDLEEAREDALDAIKTAYTKADMALLIVYAQVRKDYFNGTDQRAFNVRFYEDVAKASLAIAKTDATLSNTKQALTDIRDALTYVRSALESLSLTETVLSADKTNINTERTSIDTQLTAITTAQQGIDSTEIDNQTNINTAQANLDTSKASLKKAQDELTAEKAGPRQIDIDLAQAEVNQAMANLLQTSEKINKKTLKAPANGIITVIEKEEGETATASETIISMMSSNRFQVEANVSETEIAKVSLNDSVEMTLDALGPDEKFAGKIIKINPAETIVSGVIYYKINCLFDIKDARIKSGMTANLEIQTEKKDNILYLPYYAIQQINGRKFVIVLENGEKREKDIKTGLEGEVNIEIISGLNEADEIIVEE